MKRNEGVTILQLAITVVIMLIIMSMAILNIGATIREAKSAKIYNEIIVIESILREAEAQNKISLNGHDIKIFECIVPAANMSEEKYSRLASYNLDENCYLLSFKDNQELKNVFNLENIENDYILELDSLKVYFIDGIDDTHGTILHSAEDFANNNENAFVK